MDQAIGRLIGIKVLVLDKEASRSLYRRGFYGKPFGIRKPKDIDFEAPLELSLIEALYLVEKGLLRVLNNEKGEVTDAQIRALIKKYFRKGNLLYMVYKDLRERGFIARSGLKFGADFAVYELGPGIDHAPFLVHVVDSNKKIDPVDIVRAGRLSHSVRKKFIIATVDENTGSIKYIAFKWFKP